MDKKFFIELTNDLYKLTILFPKEEPIRIKIRSLADDVLTDLITILEGDSKEKKEAAKRVERSLGILESMLEVAQEQKWVKEEEFKEVKENYGSIKEEIEEFNKAQKKDKKDKKDQDEKPLKKERKPSGSQVMSLNRRQKDILELLEKRGKLQVQDVMDELDLEVTKRTLRRDFKKLIEMHFVEMEGKANMTRYKLNE